MADFFKSEKFVNSFQKFLYASLGGFADKLNDGPSFVSASEADSRYFYPGNSKFVDEASNDAKWNIGAFTADLTPSDYKTHEYYLGGYLTIENGFNNKIENVIDKMSCRIIAVDDSSGRGISFFGTTDCIGIGNSDIKRVRRKFADIMKIRYPDSQINTVNIFSTHTHSCVDTQGLWTDTLHKFRRNKKKNKTGKGTYCSGTDEAYMNFLTSAIAEGMVKAYENMHSGTLTYAKKDIGAEYFHNKNRASATALVTDMIRLIFTPDDRSVRPLMICSVGAHPDVAGLPTSDGQGSGRELCGEYIYYMGELLNRAGYDFMFFNGAICAIYMSRGASNDGMSFEHRYEQSIRYGRELARLALSMTLPIDEVLKDPLLYDEKVINEEKEISEKNGIPYTLWCEDHEAVTETELKPILNIRLREVKIRVNNPLIKIVGKLNLASYRVLKEKDDSYSVITEIGYLELGSELKVVMVPGEFCADLLVGGASLTAKGSFKHKDFVYPPLTKIFGCELTAFGLANDAIGYIVPDNDYVLGEFGEHYHELISLGNETASSIMKAFCELKNEIESR